MFRNAGGPGGGLALTRPPIRFAVGLALAFAVTPACSRSSAARPDGAETLAMLEAHHGGKPVAAIAAEANIPAKTYYTRAARFLRRVQKRLADVSTAARWSWR